MWNHTPVCGYHTRSHTLKENRLQQPSAVNSSSSRGGTQDTFPLHAGRLSGLILYGSYADNHSCCKFARALVLPYPEGIVILQSSPTSCLDNPSAPSAKGPKGCDPGVPLRTEYSGEMGVIQVSHSGLSTVRKWM